MQARCNVPPSTFGACRVQGYIILYAGLKHLNGNFLFMTNVPHSVSRGVYRQKIFCSLCSQHSENGDIAPVLQFDIVFDESLYFSQFIDLKTVDCVWFNFFF